MFFNNRLQYILCHNQQLSQVQLSKRIAFPLLKVAYNIYRVHGKAAGVFQEKVLPLCHFDLSNVNVSRL